MHTFIYVYVHKNTYFLFKRIHHILYFFVLFILFSFHLNSNNSFSCSTSVVEFSWKFTFILSLSFAYTYIIIQRSVLHSSRASQLTDYYHSTNLSPVKITKTKKKKIHINIQNASIILL